MAVTTYGVNLALVETYLAQLGFDTDSPIDGTTEITAHIEGAAAELNGILVDTFGTGAPAEIAADSASDAYRNCQTFIMCIATPHLLLGMHHVAAQSAIDAANDRADMCRDRLERNPGLLGHVPSAGPSRPGAQTSTEAIGLATTTTDLRDSRKYDSRRDGKDTQRLQW